MPGSGGSGPAAQPPGRESMFARLCAGDVLQMSSSDSSDDESSGDELGGASGSSEPCFKSRSKEDEAAAAIQASWRGKQARKQDKAAATIQASWRGKQARTQQQHAGGAASRKRGSLAPLRSGRPWRHRDTPAIIVTDHTPPRKGRTSTKYRAQSGQAGPGKSTAAKRGGSGSGGRAPRPGAAADTRGKKTRRASQDVKYQSSLQRMVAHRHSASGKGKGQGNGTGKGKGKGAEKASQTSKHDSRGARKRGASSTKRTALGAGSPAGGRNGKSGRSGSGRSRRVRAPTRNFLTRGGVGSAPCMHACTRRDARALPAPRRVPRSQR